MRRILIVSLAAFLCVAGIAAAASFRTGTYKGKTSQKRVMSVTVTATGMTSASYRADYRCVKGTQHGRAVKQLTKIGALSFKTPGHLDGKFKSASGTDHVHLVFTVNKRKMTGYFTETYTSVRKFTCRSGKVRFTLKH